MDRRSFNRTVGVIGMGMVSGFGPEELKGAGKSLNPGAEAPGGVAGSAAGQAGGAIDVARARQETPGCSEVTHFNNAGSSLPPQPVLDAVIGHLEMEARIGGYEAAAAAQAQQDRTYEAISTLLNCSTEEVALV